MEETTLLKRLMQKLTHFKVHYLGSSLKSAWATQAGDPLTITWCAPEAGLSRALGMEVLADFICFTLFPHSWPGAGESLLSISLHQPS